MKEIVISISESTIEYLKERCDNGDVGYHDYQIYEAIVNGTLLPKRHGRLIDEDSVMRAIDLRIEKLSEDPVFLRKFGYIDIVGIKDYIREIPTMVEAESEVEE